MVDIEGALQRLPNSPAHLVVIVGAIAHDHVGAQGRHAARDAPDVQVVDAVDTGRASDESADLVGVDAAGRGLEEHVEDLPQDRERREDDDDPDDSREDGVDAREAGSCDDGGADKHAD